MTTRPMFQRRQYAAVAKIIARAKLRPNDCVAECLDDLERDFADAFKTDNSNFRPGTFFAACDPERELDAQWKQAERSTLS